MKIADALEKIGIARAQTEDNLVVYVVQLAQRPELVLLYVDDGELEDRHMVVHMAELEQRMAEAWPVKTEGLEWDVPGRDDDAER